MYGFANDDGLRSELATYRDSALRGLTQQWDRILTDPQWVPKDPRRMALGVASVQTVSVIRLRVPERFLGQRGVFTDEYGIAMEVEASAPVYRQLSQLTAKFDEAQEGVQRWILEALHTVLPQLHYDHRCAEGWRALSWTEHPHLYLRRDRIPEAWLPFLTANPILHYRGPGPLNRILLTSDALDVYLNDDTLLGDLAVRMQHPPTLDKARHLLTHLRRGEIPGVVVEPHGYLRIPYDDETCLEESLAALGVTSFRDVRHPGTLTLRTLL